MSTSSIVNAAPMGIMLGIQDLSAVALVPEPEALPTHLPKFYIYAKQGPSDDQLVVGDSLTQMYGIDSFDPLQAYYNHATAMLNKVNAAGNQMIVSRVKPLDANPPATIRIYADVLPTLVTDYVRNSDGSIQVDSNNNPVSTGNTIPGYLVKFVNVPIALNSDGSSSFGSATQIVGDQVNASAGSTSATLGGQPFVIPAQSTRYPLMDLPASWFGGDGNNYGLRFWAPTIDSSIAIDDTLLANQLVYPFRMACAYRPNALATASVVSTLAGEQYVDVCLKPNTTNASTGAQVYMGDVFIDAYQDIDNPSNPPTYGQFGDLHVYDSEVLTLLNMFYAAEAPYINNGFSDFTGVTNEQYRFNLLSGVSSSNVPYHSYQVVTGAANSVRFSENSTTFAQGGSDGTMNDTLFSGLVATAIAEYADPSSPLSADMASHPESIFWDSGFTIDTKLALANFIATRKDTFVVVSTYDTTGPEMSASDESSLAISLLTRLQMFPESAYFGTSVARAMIVGRNGRPLNSQYKGRLPLTHDLAAKAAAYMGASDGTWKSVYNFDSAPLSKVTSFTDINATFTPASVRNQDWANGLNWVEAFDRRSVYFPALKTVFDDDSSVLTSFFTAMACVELEKVGDRARRQFSGTSTLTDAQIIERVNQFVLDNTKGRFDGRFVIVPNAYFAAGDQARGYSWTLAIQIYANNMKTVQTLIIQSMRMEDLPSS